RSGSSPRSCRTPWFYRRHWARAGPPPRRSRPPAINPAVPAVIYNSWRGSGLAIGSWFGFGRRRDDDVHALGTLFRAFRHHALRQHVVLQRLAANLALAVAQPGVFG